LHAPMLYYYCWVGFLLCFLPPLLPPLSSPRPVLGRLLPWRPPSPAWAFVPSGGLCGLSLAGFVCVPSLPCLLRVPLRVRRLLPFLVLGRSVRCGVLSVVFEFLFRASPALPFSLLCAPALCGAAVSGSAFRGRRLLLLLLFLPWLLRVCACFLACSAACLPSVFPGRVPRPVLLCLRWLPFSLPSLGPAVGCLWVVPVVLMRQSVLFSLALLRCWFSVPPPPGLVRAGQSRLWCCGRPLAFVPLLPAVVGCLLLSPPARVPPVSVPAAPFTGAGPVRGVQPLWLLV
jgi:hypothetical protein